MIISLCATEFDWLGNFIAPIVFDKSDLSYISRRVSRTATLDGSSIIVDNGYTASDATFTLVIRDIDNATRLGIMTLVKRHSLLTLAVQENIFVGAVETLADKTEMKIKFLVKDKLNED
jgi:hypothetical protein